MANKQSAVKWLREVYFEQKGRIYSDQFATAEDMDTERELLLLEAIIQLQYLNEKFGETGTTNSLLSKMKAHVG